MNLAPMVFTRLSGTAGTETETLSLPVSISTDWKPVMDF